MTSSREDQRGKSWHIEKSINLGYLLTTIVMAASVIMWAMTMDSRITVVEVQIANAKEASVNTATLLRDNFRDLKESQVRIETKMDGKEDKK